MQPGIQKNYSNLNKLICPRCADNTFDGVFCTICGYLEGGTTHGTKKPF